MSDRNFVDYVKICCRSGAGGAGSMHFRRDRLTAKGGPDGGDGGRGGHIILRGNKQLWTLLSLKYQKHVIAKPGENGGESNSSGAEGDDIFLDVPLGTVAKDVETGETLFEITEDGETRIIVAAYAFTTLTPNLGIVQYRDNRSFIMADIPGIIENAHEGKGLLPTIPKDIDHLFISSVAQTGLTELKDEVWQRLTAKES